MFESLRKAAEALQGLRVSIASVERILRTTLENVEQREALSDRIQTLEIGYAKWSAEAEATLLKADALYKNARNSEERVRDKAKRKNGAPEGGVEGEAEIRAAYAELYGELPEGDVEGVRPARMQPVREGVEVDARTLRLRAKFG